MDFIRLIKSIICSIPLSINDYIRMIGTKRWFILEYMAFTGMILSLLTLHIKCFNLCTIIFYISQLLPAIGINTPEIYSSDDEFTKEIAKGFSLKKFKMPIYQCDGVLQTINVFATRFRIKLEFDREMVKGYDDGEFAMDWLKQEELEDDAPVILIYHGLAGGCRESYIQRFCYFANQKKYRIVVFTYRGCAGTIMKTPRAYNITCLEDYVTSVNHVHSRYPKAPIINVGYSMGGMVAMTLCGRVDNLRDECNLIGSVAVSATMPSLSTDREIPSAFMDGFTKSLVRLARKNQEMFMNAMKEGKVPTFDYNLMDYVRSVPHFDNNFDCKLFGFGHYQTYYFDIEQWYHFLPQSNIPFLAINARDDPVAILPDYTMRRVKNMVGASRNVTVIVTKNGGHLGWVNGTKKINFVDETTLEYCDTLVKMFKEGKYKPSTL